MIQFIKGDFRNVREALGVIVGRKIPFVVAVLYYAIMFPIGIVLSILLVPSIMIVNQIRFKRAMKRMESYINV